MFAKLEGWLFNAFAGKLLARAAVTVAAFIAGPAVQALAAKTGVHISVPQEEVQAALVMGAHAAFEAFKAWRAKKPEPAPAPEAPKA